MKFQRLNERLLISLFLLFIFSFGVYFILSPDLKISHVEYRMLEQQPDLTFDNLLSGEYAKKYEAYFTDQFPGRNLWLRLYLYIQKFTGKTFLNDNYYISKDNWILKKPIEKLPKKELDIAAQNLNEFAKFVSVHGADLFYFSLPHRDNTINVKFPPYVKKGMGLVNKEYFLSQLSKENMKVVDIRKSFIHQFSKSELNDMYFKSDHHWNMLGAFAAYEKINKVLSREPYYVANEPAYKMTCIQNKKFEGSYNRQIYMMVDPSDEKLCLSMPKDSRFSKFDFYLQDKKVQMQTFYGSGLKSDNKTITYHGLYTLDLPEINIINHNVKNSNVLIIKDSYANPIILHIAQHFHKTTVFDIRHNERTVEQYMKEKDLDAVIIMYNDQNITGNMYKFK
jgi:hypothetical protein